MKIQKCYAVLAGIGLAATSQVIAQTQIVTLATTNGQNLRISQMSVLPNQIVSLLFYSQNTNKMVYCYVALTNGTRIYTATPREQSYGNSVVNLGQMTLTGATNIALASYLDAAATFSITTPPPQTQNYIPANTVVIPTDATGPVEVILESSSDLVNWVAALPGTYGNTYSNRFFRVRAVASP